MLRVCVAGLPNSGKSALLSALTGTCGVFAVGPAPGTTQGIIRWPSAEITWVDTPGLGSCDQLDCQLYAELRRADVTLWCHNMRLGELHKLEVEALQKYLDLKLNPRRLRLVITHSKDGISCKDARRVVHVIRNQMRSLAQRCGIARPTTMTGSRWMWGRIVCVEVVCTPNIAGMSYYRIAPPYTVKYFTGSWCAKARQLPGSTR